MTMVCLEFIWREELKEEWTIVIKPEDFEEICQSRKGGDYFKKDLGRIYILKH